MLLAPSEVRDFGLKIMNVRNGRKGEKRLELEFHKHFGVSSLDAADIWYDLCYYDQSLLKKKEKTEKGFKRTLAALYWLWLDPGNASAFASRFGCCVDYVQGKHLWKWITRISEMASKKLVWDASLDDPNSEILAFSTDGVDFETWEKQHPDLPMDPKNMSHKFMGCAAKYLIVLSVFRSKCVLIAGPFRGGLHDVDMCRQSGFMARLQQNGKVCIADRGFRSKHAHERRLFALPDYMDSPELSNFKSRARLRQESFNSRLKKFRVLSNKWRHGMEKHGIALRAVAVIVQYQMDNGSPLYSV
jgi:hypothetical protein